MQGTTPRGLTWSGLLAVLGLSATLLPLSPTWAQQRPDTEEVFYQALQKDREYNDPSWPFVVKVKDVQDKTLIGPTFKHRAGGPHDPNRFDMIVQAKTATVQFDANMGVARVHLDGAEVTDPNRKVTLIDNTTLEIPISSDGAALDDEDEEAVAPETEKPKKSPILKKPKPPVFIYRKREGEEKRESSEADPARNSTERPSKEIESDDRVAEKHRAEIAQLKAEVEHRRAALMEAELRLNKALKQMAEAGKAYGVYTPTRTRTFELRVNKSGQDPFKPAAVRIVPRPDQERRMAELEEKLEKLQDEVKTLKKDAPAPR